MTDIAKNAYHDAANAPALVEIIETRSGQKFHSCFSGFCLVCGFVFSPFYQTAFKLELGTGYRYQNVEPEHMYWSRLPTHGYRD